jgi:hypothetical protein
MNDKIKKIIARFNQEQDLKNNVLEYFSVSLFYLENLLNKQEKLENYVNIEINHLVEREIHKVLDAYLEIPLDIRNSIIRDNKTGKQLLVEQLTSLNIKIVDIWQQSINTNRIVVMHRKITNENPQNNTELEPDKFVVDIEKDAREFVQSFDNKFSFDNFKRTDDSSDKGLTPAKFLGVAVILIVVLLILASVF